MNCKGGCFGIPFLLTCSEEVYAMKDGKYCIMTADDEKDIRDILGILLRGEGYTVIEAADGQEVLDKASEEIDLYILDVNMPEMSGFMAGAELFKKYDAPIVYLTAYSGESDKVMGFSAGADDYIVKPFSNMELLMRVKAILRRSGRGQAAAAAVESAARAAAQVIQIQDVFLDLQGQNVVKGDELIGLTYTEFKILHLLASHKRKIYSLDNIYESIWDEEHVGDGAIMVHIKNIRKKLGDNSRNPKYIKTAWGRGYYVD